MGEKMINDGIITVSYAVRAPTKRRRLDTQLDCHRNTIAILEREFETILTTQTVCCLIDQ